MQTNHSVSVNHVKRTDSESIFTYIIESEQFRYETLGQILLDARLLASKEMSHGGQLSQKDTAKVYSWKAVKKELLF